MYFVVKTNEYGTEIGWDIFKKNIKKSVQEKYNTYVDFIMKINPDDGIVYYNFMTNHKEDHLRTEEETADLISFIEQIVPAYEKLYLNPVYELCWG